MRYIFHIQPSITDGLYIVRVLAAKGVALVVAKEFLITSIGRQLLYKKIDELLGEK
jgi:hypothetical protein